MDYLVRARYGLVRFMSSPVPGMAKLPIVGGKTIPELLSAAAIFVVSIIVAISSGDASAGSLASYLGLIMLLYSMRNNFILQVFGMSFERNIFIHKAFGFSMLAVMIIHAIGEGMNASGLLIAIALGCAMLSYVVLNRFNFNWFYFTHVICFLVFVPLGFIHGATAFSLGIFVWGVDMLIRYFIRGVSVKAKLSLMGEDTVKVEFPNKFTYQAGHYCFLTIPLVNSIEAHPFTIASAPYTENTCFLIKKSGDWTAKLQQLVAENSRNESGECEATVFVEGPYGSVTVDLADRNTYKVILLIAGGIGITPMLALLQDLLYKEGAIKAAGATAGDASVAKNDVAGRKIVLVWSMRDAVAADKIYKDAILPALQQWDVKYEEIISKIVAQKNGNVDLITAVTLGDGNRTHSSQKVIPFQIEMSSNGDSKKGYTAAPTSDVENIPELEVPQQSQTVVKKEQTVFMSPPNMPMELVMHLSGCKDAPAFNKVRATMSNADVWRSGRPDMNRIFTEAGQLAETMNTNRVAVCVCGPDELVKQVRSLCDTSRMTSTKCCFDTSVKFDCHEEIFNF